MDKFIGSFDGCRNFQASNALMRVVDPRTLPAVRAIARTVQCCGARAVFVVYTRFDRRLATLRCRCSFYKLIRLSICVRREKQQALTDVIRDIAAAAAIDVSRRARRTQGSRPPVGVSGTRRRFFYKKKLI